MAEDENVSEGIDQTTVLYLAISVIFSLVVAIFVSEINYKGSMHHLGFLMRFFMFIFGVPGAFLGLKAGRAIRDFTMPSAFYTTGGMKEIAKTKIFWAIGPQTIGFFVGYCIGAGIPIMIGL